MTETKTILIFADLNLFRISDYVLRIWFRLRFVEWDYGNIGSNIYDNFAKSH
jgi:hypothetical protein